MVKYGDKNSPDDVPTSMKVHKTERKYRGHKLSRGVGHIFVERHHGGESTKPNKHVDNPSGTSDRLL